MVDALIRVPEIEGNHIGEPAEEGLALSARDVIVDGKAVQLVSVAEDQVRRVRIYNYNEFLIIQKSFKKKKKNFQKSFKKLKKKKFQVKTC